ncbi:beta-glucuronosyltransferase GlcAT14B-like [Zingiber officinale]|uniref:BGGP Beta-1-3-galactosyl-O-glycosyl-glycoprotein n=1 Tax=Zingiber officinale TaxID=94328 RepID=A0A8J5FG14_ZINOF|nr:beta-glucuronosyltransferase GlcAT14B-like [Zingiber officinale]KAG6484738.1 hypothetical protein ZIOFF_053263 [Zingiber officinale]
MELTRAKGQFPMEKRWAWPLFLIAALLAVAIISSNIGIISSFRTMFVVVRAAPAADPPPSPALPRLAYLISGSKGDLDRLWRALRAMYHPRNLYVVHLDLESPVGERRELSARVAGDAVFAAVGNVRVIEKANMVTYRGPTMVANTLHACAILLKMGKNWDWFINLSASDYPLATQDDILHAFSSLPRNISFMEHTSRLGWKELKRARPLIVDPGLYSVNKSDIFWVTPERGLPSAFKLFTGSAWVAITREFAEFCVWGWDNLPRILLMYYTNFVSSPEGYFQTVICNSPQFARTVANHDLHYISWDRPPKQHPHDLTVDDFPKMVGSNALFGRKFKRNDPVLDKIDAELLGRGKGDLVPGGWCRGDPPCSKVGDVTRLVPGNGSERIASLFDRTVRSRMFSRNQCR